MVGLRRNSGFPKQTIIRRLMVKHFAFVYGDAGFNKNDQRNILHLDSHLELTHELEE